MTETSQKPVQLRKAWNKVAFWLRHSLECIFSATQIDSFHDCQDRIPVRYRAEGGLFNLRRLKDVIKVKETVIRDFFLLLTEWNGLLILRLWQHQPYQQHQKWSHVLDCTWPNAIRMWLKFRVRIKAVESEFLFGSDWKKWDPVSQKTINIS